MDLARIAHEIGNSKGVDDQKIVDLVGVNSKDHLKGFLILTVKKQLVRIVKLMDAVNMCEDILIGRLQTELMTSGNANTPRLAIEDICNMTRLLQQNLDNLMSLLRSVIDDKEYYQFILNSTSINVSSVNNSNTPTITRDSREKLRDIMFDVMSTIDKQGEGEPQAQVINPGSKKVEEEEVEVEE